MKASPWLFAAAMSASGLAPAQMAQSSGVTEITDPARIAAIEQRARELASRPAAPATATAAKDGQMKHKGMRHHKNKAMHKGVKKDKPASDTPMSTDSKS